MKNPYHPHCLHDCHEPPPIATPEPGTLWSLGMGLLLVCAIGWLRRMKSR